MKTQHWLSKIPFKGIGGVLFLTLFCTLLGRVIEAQTWAERLDKLSTMNATAKDETINLQKSQINQLNSQVNLLKKQVATLEAQKSLLNSQVLTQKGSSCLPKNLKLRNIPPSKN
ncbi:hypothetical protein [Floridanema evergladense]|uniref:Uncharacterized protein n=1 Tax=Floridaenema evergladense BLCC-F167 TaxID=3153639 RepID=A0ABV4WP35_9CYAN